MEDRHGPPGDPGQPAPRQGFRPSGRAGAVHPAAPLPGHAERRLPLRQPAHQLRGVPAHAGGPQTRWPSGHHHAARRFVSGRRRAGLRIPPGPPSRWCRGFSPARARSSSTTGISTTATICAPSTGAPTSGSRSCFSRCSRWSRAFPSGCSSIAAIPCSLTGAGNSSTRANLPVLSATWGWSGWTPLRSTVLPTGCQTGCFPRAGVIARYARYRDYHDVLAPPLKDLAESVNRIGGPGSRSLWYVDTGPLLERALAQRAGVGKKLEWDGPAMICVRAYAASSIDPTSSFFTLWIEPSRSFASCTARATLAPA